MGPFARVLAGAMLGLQLYQSTLMVDTLQSFNLPKPMAALSAVYHIVFSFYNSSLKSPFPVQLQLRHHHHAALSGIRGRLNRLPAGALGDLFVGTVKKGKPELRKKGAFSVPLSRNTT